MSRAATRFRHQVTSSLVLRPWACRCYGNLTEIAFKVKNGDDNLNKQDLIDKGYKYICRSGYR